MMTVFAVFYFTVNNTALRLIGAQLVEIDETWFCGTRYFDMVEYWEWKANTEKQRGEVKYADIQVNTAQNGLIYLPEGIYTQIRT